MPPPRPKPESAEFPNNVLFVTLIVPVEKLEIPPPPTLLKPLAIANPSIVISAALSKLNTLDEPPPLTVSEAFPGA